MMQNATAGRAGKVKAKTATTAKKPAAPAVKKGTSKKKRGSGAPALALVAPVSGPSSEVAEARAGVMVAVSLPVEDIRPDAIATKREGSWPVWGGPLLARPVERSARAGQGSAWKE